MLNYPQHIAEFATVAQKLAPARPDHGADFSISGKMKRAEGL
jgi:hypothetical protein